MQFLRLSNTHHKGQSINVVYKKIFILSSLRIVRNTEIHFVNHKLLQVK